MKYLFYGLFLFSYTALADSVYKCIKNGNIMYSQIPCGTMPEKVNIKNTIPTNTTPKTSSEIIKSCRNAILKKYSFKDPSSIIVEKTEPKWLTDKSGARRTLILYINAKNGYGGYGGSKPFPCFLNHDGNNLSTIQYLIK